MSTPVPDILAVHCMARMEWAFPGGIDRGASSGDGFAPESPTELFEQGCLLYDGTLTLT